MQAYTQPEKLKTGCIKYAQICAWIKFILWGRRERRIGGREGVKVSLFVHSYQIPKSFVDLNKPNNLTFRSKTFTTQTLDFIKANKLFCTTYIIHLHAYTTTHIHTNVHTNSYIIRHRHTHIKSYTDIHLARSIKISYD